MKGTQGDVAFSLDTLSDPDSILTLNIETKLPLKKLLTDMSLSSGFCKRDYVFVLLGLTMVRV